MVVRGCVGGGEGLLWGRVRAECRGIGPGNGVGSVAAHAMS